MSGIQTVWTAKKSLKQLEDQFATFSQEEQDEIEMCRKAFHNIVLKYGASAQLALLAINFETAIARGQ